MMNQYAQALGMTSTHFVNATGWPDDNHYSTARDLATLARALIEEFPEHYKWHAIKEFQWGDITQPNRNRLLWRDDSVDGLKTGHTEAAGYCLVASAEREGMRIVSVVLGTSSDKARIDGSQALLNYGFRFYETHKLYAAGTELTSSRIWKGAMDTTTLGIDRDLYVTIPRGQYSSLDASMSIDNRIIAPVSAGQALGKVLIKLGEDVVAEQPLVSLQNIAEGSFLQRLVDEALLYFE
jgi:D-alanyl-D-alanine carboxypeptidase (penicillin-binding protein 5/6)